MPGLIAFSRDFDLKMRCTFNQTIVSGDLSGPGRSLKSDQDVYLEKLPSNGGLKIFFKVIIR